MTELASGQYEFRRASIDKFTRFVRNLPFYGDAIEPYEPGCFDTDIDASMTSIGHVYRDRDDRVAISRVLLEEISHNGQLEIDEASFEPKRNVGAQRSRHGVFFGRVMLGSTSVNVAVKPFDDVDGSPDRQAFDELSLTHTVLNHGIRTFEPLAIGRYVGTTYLLTSLVSRVSTLDSIDWTQFRDSPERHLGMQGILSNLAKSVARVHSKGWGHGDLSPRNAALDITDEVFLLDWEFAQMGGDVTDPSVRFGRARTDIHSLVRSFYYPRNHAQYPGIELLPLDDVDLGQCILKSYFFQHYLAERHAIEQGIKEDTRQLDLELDSLPANLGL